MKHRYCRAATTGKMWRQNLDKTVGSTKIQKVIMNEPVKNIQEKELWKKADIKQFIVALIRLQALWMFF